MYTALAAAIQFLMAKNYAAVTAQYHAQHGLMRAYVRDAATGQPILRLVTENQVKKMEKAGRFVYTPKQEAR